MMPLVTRGLRRGELAVADVFLGVALALVCGYAALETPATGDAGLVEPGWVSWVVGLAIGLPVAARRRWPLTVAGVVLAAATTALLSGIIPTYAGAAPSIALACVLYIVGSTVARRRSIIAVWACVGATGVALVGLAVVARTGPDASSVALSTLVLTLAWIVGRAAQERRLHAARMLAQLTDRAVGEERMRIARELHDVVAHSMSLIAVKAAIANHVADDRPQETRDALRVIELTSRTALTEIRRTFATLRAEADFASTPGLADLPALAGWASSAGVHIDLTVAPEDAALPEGIDLAVYRIVQEAVTNVVKHAGPASCRATVLVDAEQVRLTVIDDGSVVHAPAGGGQGIIGMRERTNLYGGDFAAGPRPGGGFAVTARFPLVSA